MPPTLRSTLVPGAVAALILLPACTPGSDDVGTDDADVVAAEASGECAAGDWFPHATTPEPNSGEFDPQSQCSFHQWSWQAFLWLTQDDGTGQPRFLSFTRPQELFGSSASSALVPRMAKSQTPEPIGTFLQAGTDGIMTDQAGRPIYYSLYVDPVFERFVTENELTDPAALLAFDPTTNFPDSAMTLKASWKIVEDGEDVSGFFTTETEVYPLANRAGTIVVDTTRSDRVTLAMVGFHVAGKVRGHPEMIWATFEHVDNAPSVFVPDSAGSPPGLTDPVSNRDWTFYAAGTPRSECNVNTASSPVRRLDEAAQTISPITQVCREYRYGNLPTADPTSPIEQAAAVNDSNVASLNAHVLAGLASDDVWRNYEEVGAIWFTGADALQPGLALDGICVTGSLQDGACVDASGQPTARLIGSLRLSNSTIETFTQSQSTMFNCFRCHNTDQRLYTASAPAPGQAPTALPAKNVNISHILVNGFFRNQDE